MSALPSYLEIAQCLDAIPSSNLSRSKWTKTVKDKMANLGHKFKLQVACSGSEHRHWGEWLYDLVWYSDGEEFRNPSESGVRPTRSVELVMEIEWNMGLGELSLDFDKLLVANAPLKIMLAQYNKTHPKKTLVSYCQTAINGYTYLSNKDSIMLCLWCTDNNEAAYYSLSKGSSPRSIRWSAKAP